VSKAKTKRATRSKAGEDAPQGAPPPEDAGQDVTEESFEAPDGVSIKYQVTRPKGKPKRLVIVVHGFADHYGRYSYLIPHLAEGGAVVYAYDQRGSGHSEGKRGHVAQYQDLVNELDAFVKLAAEREPGLYTVLYAHSTGAILGLTYLYDNPQAVDATVLSAPCLILTFEAPRWKTTVAKAISRVSPAFSMQAGFDPADVSRDEEVVTTNKKDPLVTQAMTASFYRQVYLTAMPRARARIEELRVPYLLLQGSGDRLVSPAVADEFEERATAPGVVKRYEGGYHESHNDVHRDEVMADIDAWLASPPTEPVRPAATPGETQEVTEADAVSEPPKPETPALRRTARPRAAATKAVRPASRSAAKSAPRAAAKPAAKPAAKSAPRAASKPPARTAARTPSKPAARRKSGGK
jgi:acylglycerol lipase